MALPIDDAILGRTLAGLVAGPAGLVLVAGQEPVGFLAASVGVTAISLAPVAQEHGWWAEPGSRAGLRLLLHYERWARDMGCAYVRMSTPPHNDRAAQLLEKRGFFVSELCWVKAL